MSSENRVLRSSSFFIKDGEKLLGMLCINVDMNNYIQLCEEIMALSGTSVSSVELIPKSDCTTTDFPSENFSNDLSTSIDNILKQQSKHLTTVPSRLNKKERMNFIKDLNKSGLFFMKGSIPAVATHLNCSEATIYRYLSEVNHAEV